MLKLSAVVMSILIGMIIGSLCSVVLSKALLMDAMSSFLLSSAMGALMVLDLSFKNLKNEY